MFALQTGAVLQTVCGFHSDARMAHLNISTECVAMLNDPVQPWDHIRLLGFGFSKKIKKGDYHPHMLTSPYSATNQAHSLTASNSCGAALGCSDLDAIIDRLLSILHLL